MVFGILIGIALSALVLLAVFIVLFLVGGKKIQKAMDHAEKVFMSQQVSGKAEFIIPDRVKEITQAKSNVSIDEVLI